jgi:large subunit ribosomal protein L30
VIKIEQTGSPIRRPHDQRETLIGLGLNRIRRAVEMRDTLQAHGMLAKVKHLVRATRFYFGDGTTTPVWRATDLKRYLPPKEKKKFRQGYSMAESAKYWLAAAEQTSPVSQYPIGKIPFDIAKLAGSDLLKSAHFEYPVTVWGGGKSMTDIMAFTQGGIIAVEAKAREKFADKVREWAQDKPNRLNVVDRYAEAFKVARDDLMGLRYQLLHRTLSAALVASKYGRKSAWMIVHSFAPLDCEEHLRNRKDFDDYVKVVGPAPVLNDVPVHLAWVDAAISPTNRTGA